AEEESAGLRTLFRTLPRPYSTSHGRVQSTVADDRVGARAGHSFEFPFAPQEPHSCRQPGAGHGNGSDAAGSPHGASDFFAGAFLEGGRKGHSGKLEAW